MGNSHIIVATPSSTQEIVSSWAAVYWGRGLNMRPTTVIVSKHVQLSVRRLGRSRVHHSSTLVDCADNN